MCQYFIRYKSPPTQNHFGLLYRLDKCFSYFFIHRTLHPGKIYPVKNNSKNYSQIGETFVWKSLYVRVYWSAVNQKGKTFIYIYIGIYIFNIVNIPRYA